MTSDLTNIALKKIKGTKKPKQAKGDDLFNQVIQLTGIPAKTIRHELKTILERKNIDIKHLTVDQLREVVASYLREIMGSLLDRTTVKRPDHTH